MQEQVQRGYKNHSALTGKVVSCGVKLLTKVCSLDTNLREMIQEHLLSHKRVLRDLISVSDAHGKVSELFGSLLPSDINQLDSGGFSLVLSFLCELCTKPGAHERQHAKLAHAHLRTCISCQLVNRQLHTSRTGMPARCCDGHHIQRTTTCCCRLLNHCSQVHATTVWRFRPPVSTCQRTCSCTSEAGVDALANVAGITMLVWQMHSL